MQANYNTQEQVRYIDNIAAPTRQIPVPENALLLDFSVQMNQLCLDSFIRNGLKKSSNIFFVVQACH